MNSLYGNYRTRKFAEIWNNAEDFADDCLSSGVPVPMKYASVTTLYYLLYARYGNSCIANSDENQFKYKIYSTMFAFGGTWEKRVEVQEIIRNLSEDELRSGSKQINNHAYNPSTEPGINTEDELSTINEQSSTNFKKGKLDAYSWLWENLKTDVTTQFLDRFQPLFLQVVAPQEPLWYVTDIDDE